MYITLANAPIGKPLILRSIRNEILAEKLQRLGFYEGTGFKRDDKEVLLQTVRVKGPNGEFILGGRMSSKIVVHLDDGRKCPLAEMVPGEKGHIEGLTGGNTLAKTLLTLGFDLEDEIEFVRKIPPMEYLTQLENGESIRLTEGMASKIWGIIRGTASDQPTQFCSSQVQKPFEVIKIFGGQGANHMIEATGIQKGSILQLKAVEQAKTIYSHKANPIIVSIHSGLRFFLSESDARQLLVKEE